MTTAVPAAGIAYKKNLDAVAWFCVGAILGAFGIVAVLCQPRRASVWWRAGGKPAEHRGWAVAGTAAAAVDDDAGKRPSTATVMPSILRKTRGMRRGQAGAQNNVRLRRGDRVWTAVSDLAFPAAVFKTCPWQPRSLVETGLRQWLRCAAPALRDHQVIGMPSRAVDEAWHGLILCTARYSAFCMKACGEFLHHHPDGGAPTDVAVRADSMDEQLRRTVIAWSLVAKPGEQCVLWDLDNRVGVDHPWGLDAARVAAIQDDLTRLQMGGRK